MKKLLLVLLIALFPAIGFAKKPLPTDEAGLRVLAEGGNKDAMYELARLLDDVDLVMDLEGFTVTPSPGAERSREAYYWYKKVYTKFMSERSCKARWKLFCMLVRPREGIDIYPTRLARENEAATRLAGTNLREPQVAYFFALLHYYGGAHFGFLPNSDFANYRGRDSQSLYASHYSIREFFKNTDSSHPLYANAQVISDATKEAYEAGKMTVGDWINFAGALTDVANLTQAGSLQELTYGLNNLAAQTAMAEQATAAAAAPAAPLSALWRIQYSPEYIEQVRAQCRAIGIVPPKYLETGYSEEAFGSANDAHAWLRNQFSEGALSDLYSAGKVGVPVLTSW